MAVRKILEKDIQMTICKYLEIKGIFFWRQNNTPIYSEGRFRAMPKYSKKGIPDIIAILPPFGRFIGIEVKRPNGVISSHQEAFRRQLEAVGGEYIIATNLKDVIDFLKQFENR